jgi:hypothetical protein
MNVYSVKLIPNLKLKFCEFFGIASTMAIGQLQNRIDRLEVLMSRLDGRMRRSSRKQSVVISLKDRATKKKPKKQSVTKLPPASKPANRTPEIAEVAKISKPAAPIAGLRAVEGSRKEAVVLIQPDEGTRRVVQEYFGETTTLLEVQQVQDIDIELRNHKAVAILFDRMLLGQDETRGILAGIAQSFPETRMIGLSSYLTLAFSQSLPSVEDFATFLTKPVSKEALAETFEGKGKRAIS